VRLPELIARTGIAERQVRYLISEGFIPGPSGGRANADYGDAHVAGIRRYMRLRELGFPPAAIKLLLEAREGTPFPIVPGITLLVSPDLMASGAAVAPLLEQIQAILTKILEEPEHAQ
jgi:MerR family transcriptional regulator, copper efflux regulator